MLVFFVILAFLAEGFCEDAVIEKSTRPRLCGENEVHVKCRTICQPQFCNVSYTTYVCDGVQKCEPGCDCIKNHLRDGEGRCVPIEKCPPPPIQCGENQVPSDCADNYSEFPQITLCRPGCRCIENHTRNSYDDCVPTPPPLVCGENEEASTCKQTCPPQDCSWDPTRYACKPGPCQPGCNCKKDRLRDKNGKCIWKEMCPPNLPQCGDNEEPTDCARNIRPFDSTLTIKCRPCQCIQGYVRDINGVCVLKEDFCKNEPNTTYTLCPNRCKSTCKNPNGICSADCREGYGCGCTPGYLFSEQGKCILPEDCPGGNPCGRNQSFVYCNAGCPTADCPTTNTRGIIACSPPNPCPSGCACKRNYKRQKDSLCILASECPPLKCPENERWYPCPPACFSDNCGDKQTKIVCMTLIAHECQPQCVCKENYGRNSAGKCIPISQCPPQCGKNEEPTDCGDTYPQPLATDVASASRIRCQPGCRCIAGYIRDSTGACVLKRLQCGKNEEPNFCIAIFPSTCPPCRCIANHTRNSLGICVPASPLPQCGKNEEPNDCSLIYPQPIQPLSEILIDVVVAESIDIEQIRIRCQPCKCIKGYERNIKGVCVLIIQCGENEEPSDCKQECPPQYCSWDPMLMDCKPVGCKAGCNCVKGHLRDANGNCIPREQCPECNGDKNAIYTKCPNQCVSTCKKPNAICSQECGEPFGCKCKYNYILSENGRCILPKECPGGNPCGRNETFYGCVIGCPTNNCPRDGSGAIAQCLPRNPCPSGCACKLNYKRVSFEDKRCISVTDCPPIKCGKNENYNSCPSACFSEGCGSPQLEPKTCNTLVPNVCRPRCVCKEEFRRDSSGYCIPKEKCPPQCGENEEPTDCGDIVLPQPLTTDVASESIRKCQPGCTCIAGYSRDSNGVCVLKRLQCGKNEEPNFCIAIFPSTCPPCRCIANHTRNSLGICVPASPLPQCGKNEEPNDCSLIYPQPIQPLSEILIDVVVAESIDIEQIRIRCQPCKCIKGYERNIKGVCVLIIQCGENEEPSDCKQECPPQYCSWDPMLMDCKPVGCKAGCNCVKGHLRDANGNCIPREQCPECNGDKNAIYTKCPNQCVSTCKKPNAICSQECGEPFGCKCKYNYILSDNGRCILPKECPGGNPCGRNETFFGCVFGCPTNNCLRDGSGAIVQCLPPNPCPSGCACKLNYKRVSFEDKRCISVTDCPPIKCGKNENYNSCPSACFSEGCGSPQLEPKTCNTLVPNVCRPRCVCKEEFRRDSSGYCIPKEKCPPQCGENEEPTDCGDIFLPQSLTTDVASESIRKCQPGCTCIAGYSRDSNGVCVLTPRKCTGKNEVINKCPSACFGDNCGELDEDTAACNTLLPYVCKPRCMCRKGYRRDCNGNCIPKEDCPAVS